MTRLLSIIVTLVLALPALAGWPDARIVKLSDGGSGSFVDVGGKVYIISCAHRSNTSAVRVGTRVGFQCNDDTGGTATVVAVAPFDLDSETISDCALLEFPGEVNCKPFKISQRPLEPGDPVWVSGFPQNRPGYWSRRTRVLSDNGTLWIDGHSTGGESGGPIVNQHGELVGTLSATTSMGRTMCSGRGVAMQLCQSYCGGCAQGSCGYGPQYYQPPPQWRPPQQSQQQRPSVQQQPPRQPELPVAQPVTPPMPGPPGPQGPEGPPGPPGPPGAAAEGVACDCGPKWVEINAAIAALRADIDASSKATADLTLIVGDLSKRPPAPTMDEILAEVKKRRKPPRLRIVDPQGRYTTEFVTLSDSTDNDLVIEQRFTTPAQ